MRSSFSTHFYVKFWKDFENIRLQTIYLRYVLKSFEYFPKGL
jgi:hypothetical protein